MTTKLVIVCLVLFVSSTLFAQPLRWEQLSNPGECPPISCFYHDGTTLYAGTKIGIVYRTTDMGENWEQLGDGWKDVGIRGVAARGSRIYASTDSSLFMSTDNGKTWKFKLSFS